MTSIKQIPQLKTKIQVVGKYKSEFVDFVKSLGLESILSDCEAGVTVVTEAGMLPEKYSRLAYPYCKDCKTDFFKGKKVLTYAVEDNGADVVAKNVTDREGFVTFELLSSDGIGRVYAEGDIEKIPIMALALACGLMLAGVPAKDAIAMISTE